MAFIQLVKFDRDPQNAHDTEGARLLINTNRIAEVAVKTKVSDHTGKPEYKWLSVTFFDDEWETVCPLDSNDHPMKPSEARDFKDAILLECFQAAAQRN